MGAVHCQDPDLQDGGGGERRVSRVSYCLYRRKRKERWGLYVNTKRSLVITLQSTQSGMLQFRTVSLRYFEAVVAVLTHVWMFVSVLVVTSVCRAGLTPE